MPRTERTVDKENIASRISKKTTHELDKTLGLTRDQKQKLRQFLMPSSGALLQTACRHLLDLKELSAEQEFQIQALTGMGPTTEISLGNMRDGERKRKQKLPATEYYSDNEPTDDEPSEGEDTQYPKAKRKKTFTEEDKQPSMLLSNDFWQAFKKGLDTFKESFKGKKISPDATQALNKKNNGEFIHQIKIVLNTGGKNANEYFNEIKNSLSNISQSRGSRVKFDVEESFFLQSFTNTQMTIIIARSLAASIYTKSLFQSEIVAAQHPSSTDQEADNSRDAHRIGEFGLFKTSGGENATKKIRIFGETIEVPARSNGSDVEDEDNTGEKRTGMGGFGYSSQR